ncbi:TPA: MurR/RpiR family transcriptional regulator [Streptococcus suis]|nr:MurR/RpiR family transcriptional regulator [Streptococcus suis]
MNPLLIMESQLNQFSAAELAIYKVIKEQPSLVTHLTTTALAEKAGVSQPTLTRFVKKQLGYERYQDFRFDFINWLSTNSDEIAEKNDYFSRLEKLIKLSKTILNDETMTELVTEVSKSSHIFVTGGAKSYLSAKLFETLMRKMGILVTSYTTDFLDDAVNYIQSEDILITFSASGNSPFIEKVLATDSKKMLITANHNSKYKTYFDKIIILPTVTSDWEYDSISPILFDIFTELFVTYFARIRK